MRHKRERLTDETNRSVRHMVRNGPMSLLFDEQTIRQPCFFCSDIDFESGIPSRSPSCFSHDRPSEQLTNWRGSRSEGP